VQNSQIFGYNNPWRERSPDRSPRGMINAQAFGNMSISARYLRSSPARPDHSSWVRRIAQGEQAKALRRACGEREGPALREGEGRRHRLRPIAIRLHERCGSRGVPGGERLTPSHAVKKGRRYRYYASAALITEAGTERAQGWRLAAREIEEAVITILVDALTSPARLLDSWRYKDSNCRSPVRATIVETSC